MEWCFTFNELHQPLKKFYAHLAFTILVQKCFTLSCLLNEMTFYDCPVRGSSMCLAIGLRRAASTIRLPSRVLKQTTQIILTQTENFPPDSDVDEFIFLSQQKERESFSSNEN